MHPSVHTHPFNGAFSTGSAPARFNGCRARTGGQQLTSSFDGSAPATRYAVVNEQAAATRAGRARCTASPALGWDPKKSRDPICNRATMHEPASARAYRLECPFLTLETGLGAACSRHAALRASGSHLLSASIGRTACAEDGPCQRT